MFTELVKAKRTRRHIPTFHKEHRDHHKTLKAKIHKHKGTATGGGPYIGPRGGKWADPEHTIAWKEPEVRKPSPQERGYVKLTLRDKNDNRTAHWVHPDKAAELQGSKATHWDEATKPEKKTERKPDKGGSVAVLSEVQAPKGGGVVDPGAGGGRGGEPAQVFADKREAVELPEGLYEDEKFTVSANRPPNFLGLLASAFKFSGPHGKWKNYLFDTETRDPFLEDLGWYDDEKGEGPFGGEWGRNFFADKVYKKKSWDMMNHRGRDGRKSEGELTGSIIRNLTAWWSDLRDHERETFWATYCDPDYQWKFGKVTDPRHENADFETPLGMEKFTAHEDKDGNAFQLHEYQRKAVNFAMDGADNGRAIWAMEMGLGKTLSALSLYHATKARGEVKQMFVTAPISAHGSWQNEIARFSDARAVVLTGELPAKRRAIYAAFERGEIDILVVAPGTLAEKPKKIVARKKKGEIVKTRAQALDDLPIGAVVKENASGGYTRHAWKKAKQGWQKEGYQDEFGGEFLSSTEVTEGKRHSGAVAHDPAGPLTYMDPEGDVPTLTRIMHDKGAECLRIADEIHKFKNPQAQQSAGFWDVMTSPEGRVIGMTGTPKPNKAKDFYYVVNAISPGALGESELDYGNKYAYMGRDYMGEKTLLGLRPDKLGELYADAANVVFARTTADPDVEIHLPERIDVAPRIPEDDTQLRVQQHLIYYMDLKSRIRELEKMTMRGPNAAAIDGLDILRDELYQATSGKLGAEHRAAAKSAPTVPSVALLRWKQLAIDPSLLDRSTHTVGHRETLADVAKQWNVSEDQLREWNNLRPGRPVTEGRKLHIFEWERDNPGYESPKLAACVDAVTEHMTQNKDKAAVLFVEYTGAFPAIKRALAKRGVKMDQVGFYSGSVSGKKRRQLEKDLNEGRIKFLVASTKSMETGANLQHRANFVCHVSTPWEPDVLVQSTARVYRQGQQNAVTVFRPVGSHVEEVIESVVSRKIAESAQAIGREMQAEAAAGATMRAYGKNALTGPGLEKILGLPAGTFMRPGEKPTDPYDLAALAEMEEDY